MYTLHTYQDWESTPEHERTELLRTIIGAYRRSKDFRTGLTAMQYFRTENPAVASKMLLRPVVIDVEEKLSNGQTIRKKTNRKQQIEGNRVHSGFFSRFVIQQNQYLLANGVTLDSDETKKRLGRGFDKMLEKLGEKALIHGVAWGYWNADHLEVIESVKDSLSGAVALVDERTSEPMLLIQFWQIASTRPLYVRVYGVDGVVEYRTDEKGDLREIDKTRRPYIVSTMTDAMGTVETGGANYGGRLPVLPLWASEERRSELTPAIKSKIDLYDRIFSDFGDNLDRACDIYWVLNNFGGTMSDIAETIAAIEELKAVANVSDGVSGGSTAEPKTIEVPYQARQAALSLLEKALYHDYMAMNMSELTGGSLTNVAIKTARANMDLKADRYEWQCFDFVQRLLILLGVETEDIKFQRQTIANESEIVQDIATMREDIDQETALRINPYIADDEIEGIMERSAAERYAGAARLPTEEVTDDGSGNEDGSQDRAGDA